MIVGKCARDNASFCFSFRPCYFVHFESSFFRSISLCSMTRIARILLLISRVSLILGNAGSIILDRNASRMEFEKQRVCWIHDIHYALQSHIYDFEFGLVSSLVPFVFLQDNAKNYMEIHNVPGDLQRRVLKWYDYSWSRWENLTLQPDTLDFGTCNFTLNTCFRILYMSYSKPLA